MPVGPGAIHASFRLMAKLFPARPLECVTPLTLDELKEEYKTRDRLGNWGGFLLFIALGIGFYFLLGAAADYASSPHLDAEYLIRPIDLEKAFFAGFLSLTSTMAVVWTLLWIILGGAEFRAYSTYASHRAYPPAPWNATKVAAFTLLLGFFPLAILAVFRADEYTAFAVDVISINRFGTLGKEKQHLYSDVRGVYEIRGYHARFEDRLSPRQLIDFKDGDRWRSARGSGGLKLSRQREIIAFAAKQAGLKVKEVDFEEEIPP